MICFRYWIVLILLLATQVRAEGAQKPNILILSFCSVRASHLNPYQYKVATTPNLLKFSQNAFVFNQAYNHTSWTNAAEYIANFSPKTFKEKGYEMPNNGRMPYFVRIPDFQTRNKFETEEMNYADDLAKLKKTLLQKRSKPFFIFVHTKYQHFPYLDRMHKDFKPELFLSEHSKELFKKYLAKPESYPEKFSFLSVMLRDFNLALKNPEVKKRLGNKSSDVQSPFGLLNDPENLERWKKSADYEGDLELLKELYDAKLHYLDSFIADTLNLYGDKQLQDNTIVVFTGDHGESFMDHSWLLHGEGVYDEVTRFPLIIRFPKTKLTQPKYIDTQVHQRMIADLVNDVTSGKLDESKMMDFVNARKSDETITMRNCLGSVRGLRYQNHWKFILDSENRTRELYDLSKDPGEKNNVFETLPDMAGRFEEMLTNALNSDLSVSHPTCIVQ